MNNITLAGVIDSDITFSHSVISDKFNEFFLVCSRNSGIVDRIKCVVTDFMSNGLEKNCNIEISGEIRTRNYDGEDGKRHVSVYVLVNQIFDYAGEDKNYVSADCYIAKEPTYRKTPLGRQISDLLVACHRRTMKSDYINCIAWGRNAIKSSMFNVGDHIELNGRLQSREYKKKIDDETYEVRTAYELSASMIAVVEESEEIDESSN